MVPQAPKSQVSAPQQSQPQDQQEGIRGRGRGRGRGNRGRGRGRGQKRSGEPFQQPPPQQPTLPPIQPQQQQQAHPMPPQCSTCMRNHHGKCKFYKDSTGVLIPYPKTQKTAAQQQQPQQQQPQQQTTFAQFPPPAMCMSYNRKLKRIEVAGAVTRQQPGGGKKIVVDTMIFSANKFIPSRIWLDTGSQITLISRSFVALHGLKCCEADNKYVLQGVNSVSSLSDSQLVYFQLAINSHKIRISALVSDSPLLQGDDHILLGSDNLRKRIGFIAPCDESVTWWSKQEEQLTPLNTILELSYGNAGRASTADVPDLAWQMSDDSLSHSVLPDSLAVGAHQVTQTTELQGIVGNPLSGRQVDVHSMETVHLLTTPSGEQDNYLADRVQCDISGGQGDLGKVKSRVNPFKRLRKSKQFRLSKNKRKKAAKANQRHLRRLARQKRSKLLKVDPITGKPLITRYPPSDEPVLDKTNDIIAALIDHKQNFPFGFRSLLPTVQHEVVSSIQLTAQLPQHMATKIEWTDSSDKTITHIHHKMSEMEQRLLSELIKVNEGKVLTTGPITLGQANVNPFQMELYEGGELRLAKKKPRAFPLKGPHRLLLEKCLKEMEAAGVGDLNPPDLLHASPCFFAKRPRSDKLRLCYASVELNKETKDLVHPLPIMTDIIDTMQGKEYFTLLDLKSGYWQVPLSNQARRYCGMITQLGTFQWKVLPFGLKNGPAHFQREMRETLGDLIGKICEVYIDDIIIYSNTFAEHLSHIQQVFAKLEAKNWKVSMEKAHFCLSQIKLLGKIVNKLGVLPDPDMISDMKNFPEPRSVKHVMSFLGLCGVYRDFIPDWSAITDPLYKFTHKNNSIPWGDVHMASFLKLKEAMLSATILRHPDFSKDFHIFSDASSIGGGAVLVQQTGDTYFPVSYASWIFDSTERNYSTTEREMLALVKAVRKWKGYFLERKFLAKTDHKALTGVMNLWDPHGRIARWMMELNEFSYKIEHIPGKENIVPDSMSRAHEVQVGAIADILADTGNIESYELVAGLDVLQLPSDEEWAAEQRKDPYCYPIIRYLEKNELPDDNLRARDILREVEHFKLDKNILSKVVTFEGDNIPTMRKVIPVTWRKLITTMFHDSMYRGTHAGRDKTLQNMSETFWFLNMSEYVSMYIKTCHTCQRFKDPRNKSWTPLGDIEADYPLDLISIDLWSSGVTSRSDNKYVLTIIDGFSKFVQVKVLKDKSAELVAAALVEYFTTFGYPSRVHSDQGKEFVNEVLSKALQLIGITKSNTTAYHPQGNAYAERIHKFFRQAIASYVDDDHRIWDEIIPVLVACYNDSYHSALGCTPAEVFIGRRLNISPLPQKGPVGEYTQFGYVQRLEYILAKTHAMVFERIQEKRDRNLPTDPDRQPTSFKIDDEVMLYRPQAMTGESRKLSAHWYGPYKVHMVGRHNKVYYLKDPLGDPLKYPVSYALLKPYLRRPGESPQFFAFPNEDSGSETSKDDDSSPNSRLAYDDPSDAYVPPFVINDNVDEEEREILEELQEPSAVQTKTRQSVRTVKKIFRPQQTFVSDKRKVRKRWY